METNGALGPLVLVGSGEYTPELNEVDRFLIERCSGPILLIATSCAMEGLDVMERWEQMGVRHFKALGAEATPLRIVDRDDAQKRTNAERIAEAGIVWFSGGTAAYLAQTFDGTLCFEALDAANRRGAAVAGSSGGLGVLNAHVPNAPFNDRPGVDANGTNGLGLAAPTRALAHFDRMESRRPEMVERIIAVLEPGQTAVGVEEDTALVWTDNAWRVMGRQRAVVFDPAKGRTVFRSGDGVSLLAPPARSLAASV